MMYKNISIAMFWAQWAALASGLLAAFELTPHSPFVGIILYLLLKEGSELTMALHLAYLGDDDGTNSY